MCYKVKVHIAVFPEVMRDFRVFAAHQGVKQGAALAALLALARSRPVSEVAVLMGSHDDQEGERVLSGMSNEQAVAKARSEDF